VDIVSLKRHEKSKKVLEVEEFNTLMVVMHIREDSLLVEDFINLPKEQVLISLANAMTSLPNGILL
jgi:hypothetical protein